MRAVTSATAAVVLGLERKSFDNLIARLESPDLPVGRQGVERRIPVELLPRLLLAMELAQRLRMPHREAFRVAGSLLNGDQPAAPFVTMRAELDLLRREVERQLEGAIETLVRPPRGRPPRRGDAA